MERKESLSELTEDAFENRFKKGIPIRTTCANTYEYHSGKNVANALRTIIGHNPGLVESFIAVGLCEASALIGKAYGYAKGTFHDLIDYPKFERKITERLNDYDYSDEHMAFVKKFSKN